MEQTTIIKSMKHWRELLKDRKFCISLIAGFLIMLLALCANLLASHYVDSISTYPVGDIILDNIKTYNLHFLYTVGLYILLGVIILYPIFFKPEIAPFTLKTFAAFIIIRSLFISLTHLGVPEGFFGIDIQFPQKGFFRFFHLNDLFFSGHTGIPFLGFLIFKENIVRYFLLLGSFVMGATVLLMHVHYSIDVFSAYFITYSIYVVSDKIFNNLNLKFKRIVEKVEKRERQLYEFLKQKSQKTLEKIKKH